MMQVQIEKMMEVQEMMKVQIEEMILVQSLVGFLMDPLHHLNQNFHTYLFYLKIIVHDHYHPIYVFFDPVLKPAYYIFVI